MIEGTKYSSEQDYRNLLIDSSSSLKDFSLDRRKYYSKYILGKEVEEKDTLALRMGVIVEILLLEPERFDEKFYLSACAKAPTGKMVEFVEALYTATRNATNSEGVIMRNFSDYSKEAFNVSGFSGKGNGSYETIINKFSGSDAEIYYNELLKVRTNNLIVVTAQDISNAEKIVEELKTNFVTKDVIGLVNSVNYTVLKQLQVEGFEIDRLPLKSMMDLVIFSHKNKTIEVYDLKCSYSVEGFFKDYYLFRRAYIQSYVYMKAIEFYRNEMYPDYIIKPIQFIVCDSINYFNPLIYRLTKEDILDAYNGFEYKGYYYPGIKEVISELLWSKETNIWNISKAHYLSNGIVNLKE